MSTPFMSGDGIFSHVFIAAADIPKSVAFYDAALGALGIKNLGSFGKGAVLFGHDKPAFIVGHTSNGEAPSSNGVTIGFAAPSQAAVDAFYVAGLAAGGTDAGQPGARNGIPGAYAAYLRDPAGNKICSYTFS